MRALLAQNDRSLTNCLVRALKRDACCVAVTTEWFTAARMLREDMPDLLILDLNVSVKQRIGMLQDVRRTASAVPVIVLARSFSLQPVIRYFDHGADDVLIKPFAMGEFRARCRALLRRSRNLHLDLQVRNLALNRVAHTVCRGGVRISLSKREFELLDYLMLNRNRCVSRNELLTNAWKMGTDMGSKNLDVYINYLRSKLNDHGPVRMIRSVRGQGYMFATEPQLDL